MVASISSNCNGKLAGCVLLELPLKEGQEQKSLELLMQHPHGVKYTMAQPGCGSYSIGLDGNVLVLNGYWETKEQWIAYAGSRQVKEGKLGEKNAQWDETFGPFIDGELRAAPMDIIKTYHGSAKDITKFSGMPRVEFPIMEDKLDEAVQVLMNHPHGIDFLMTMPGVKEVCLAKDTEKNSIIIMGKIESVGAYKILLPDRIYIFHVCSFDYLRQSLCLASCLPPFFSYFFPITHRSLERLLEQASIRQWRAWQTECVMERSLLSTCRGEAEDVMFGS